MNLKAVRADILLLITSAIWGFAFVAQRVGMEYVGPFIFNAIRFALGSLALLPLIYFRNKRIKSIKPPLPFKRYLKSGLIAGSILFFGASFQQVGMVYTTAGKAGFITGLYVILVPIIGLFWSQKISIFSWIGALAAVAGLYLLTIHGTFSISLGDGLVLVSAFFWASHVQVIGKYSREYDVIKLASLQFFICSLYSFIVALLTETNSLYAIFQAGIPILYGGLVSVGIAYTLQVVAQQHAPPTHAAIIMALEAAFAVLGGWWLLNEFLSTRGLIGCCLMLAGMILSSGIIGKKKATTNG